MMQHFLLSFKWKCVYNYKIFMKVTEKIIKNLIILKSYLMTVILKCQSIHIPYVMISKDMKTI
jgi:hypothetical protein